ncbi:hypothetical protein GF343_03925 [Candidatus Woesearchaeota archaeon]|nr:hypothetical protein [Candidatus Woesearchaeota archaeon]
MKEKPNEQENRNCRQVLSAIMASTLDDGHTRLPAAQEYVFYTFAKGVIEYIGGDTAGLTEDRHNELLRQNHHAVAEQLEAKGEALEPMIRETAVTLTRPFWADVDIRDKNYLTCALYKYFKGPHGGLVDGIRPLGCMGRTFSPAYGWVKDAREKKLPAFTEKQRRDIEGIAKKVREIWTENSQAG